MLILVGGCGRPIVVDHDSMNVYGNSCGVLDILQMYRVTLYLD